MDKKTIKLIALILSVMLSCVLCACGNSVDSSTGTSTEKQEETEKTEEKEELQSKSFDNVLAYEDDNLKFELVQFFEEEFYTSSSGDEPVRAKNIAFKITNKSDYFILFNPQNWYIGDEHMDAMGIDVGNSAPKPGKSTTYSFRVSKDTKPDPTPLDSLDDLYGVDGDFDITLYEDNDGDHEYLEEYEAHFSIPELNLKK